MCQISSKTIPKFKNDTYSTVQREFVAILTSTYLLQYTRFTRLLRCTPSQTEYDKSSTPLVSFDHVIAYSIFSSADFGESPRYSYSLGVWLLLSLSCKNCDIFKLFQFGRVYYLSSDCRWSRFVFTNLP